MRRQSQTGQTRADCRNSATCLCVDYHCMLAARSGSKSSQQTTLSVAVRKRVFPAVATRFSAAGFEGVRHPWRPAAKGGGTDRSSCGLRSLLDVDNGCYLRPAVPGATNQPLLPCRPRTDLPDSFSAPVARHRSWCAGSATAAQQYCGCEYSNQARRGAAVRQPSATSAVPKDANSKPTPVSH